MWVLKNVCIILFRNFICNLWFVYPSLHRKNYTKSESRRIFFHNVHYTINWSRKEALVIIFNLLLAPLNYFFVKALKTSLFFRLHVLESEIPFICSFYKYKQEQNMSWRRRHLSSFGIWGRRESGLKQTCWSWFSQLQETCKLTYKFTFLFSQALCHW